MVSNFNCPICDAHDWQTVKTFHYRQQDALATNSLPSFSSLRRQILFTLWFPNTPDVALTAIYCNNCGFMCYTPRPTNEDLQAKYQYLGQREEIGALHNPSQRALRLDRKREQFMYRVITRQYSGISRSVLDVGGGDGRLMRPFLANGYACSVVDFNQNPYPGITRLGATLDDLPADARFDILICSHVLEHVSDPALFLQKLRSRLAPNGVLYIEVPLEIWKEIPITKDPVTHINFFTVSSLKNALLLNGLHPLEVKYRLATYGGNYKRVAWALATATEVSPATRPLENARRTRALLRPGAYHTLLRKAENFWIRYVLNLPPKIAAKFKALRPAKSQPAST
ncbi:class I SAM-dependent methyltransferase [Pontibacter liquoris]|uniref:class I SAM-dependent methyltransferase n=1 Tax=Pontibacter liquoris TaxID=2905677 RepID=UPI001FA7C966|nr:class I SAM-dependent methyltransferase [Pontibacter liquoris]